jgi:hypothetical protein
MRKIAIVATLLAALPAASAAAPGADCSRTSTGLVPLTDLGTSRYHGFRGGLYPGGRNTPSKRYLEQGLAAARTIGGARVVLLSIGMSNATQEFSVFRRLADADPAKSRRLTIVDGAQGGQDAVRISDPNAAFWREVDRRVSAAGATGGDVQAVWLKEAIAGPREAFPADAHRLQGGLRNIVRILAARFPRLRLVYLSSRTYAGYATTPLNPEPYAYQSGFAVKWAIEDRIEGKLAGPWLGWGPYLWTDGTRGRKDGFTWTCADVRPDGTHPSDAGAQKVAQRLLAFFKSDTTTRKWFTGQ